MFLENFQKTINHWESIVIKSILEEKASMRIQLQIINSFLIFTLF